MKQPIRIMSVLASLLLLITNTCFAELDATASARLQAVLDARSDELKQRDDSRHPAQTIDFFGVIPGMKIAEVLPGGGWYSKILAPYVGSGGGFYGVNYADDMWALFGFFDETAIVGRIASKDKFAATVAGYPGAADVPAKGYAFGGIDPAVHGTLDAVIMIRALHNLNRFEATAATRSAALKDVNAILKVGGIVGVVQHRAPADAGDGWANGDNGYLKEATVLAMFELAGFDLVASSDVNANPNDKPIVGDSVWRLPPTLRVADEKKAANKAIGESDRMTLLFRKR